MKKGDIYTITVTVEHESIIVNVINLSTEQSSQRVINWRYEQMIGNVISEMITKMKHDEDSRGGC